MSSMKTSISSSLIVLAALMLSIIPIKAEENQLTNVSFKYWKQGTTITSSQNQYSLSTVGLVDGFYTTTLANERVRDFSEVTGMKVDISTFDQDLRVNLIFGADTAIIFENGSVMIALNEETGEIHRLSASFGTFTIPANFIGTLYFPFSSLKSEVEKIDYWGLTLVQEEETVVEFKILGVSTLGDEDDDEYDKYIGDEFITPQTLQIPVVGESIAILEGPIDGEYSTVSQTKGVLIFDNRLTLTTEAIKGEFDYRFTYENGKFIQLSTNLVQSWIIGVEDQGIPLAIPLKSINILQRYGNLLDNGFQHNLRLIIGIFSLLFLIFYRFIRRKGGN